MILIIDWKPRSAKLWLFQKEIELKSYSSGCKKNRAKKVWFQVQLKIKYRLVEKLLLKTFTMLVTQ
jgi:hypothetical protein